MKFQKLFSLFMASAMILSQTQMLTGFAKEKVISDSYTEAALFDSQKMHTVNLHISQENWDFMIAHATEEKYVSCDAEIDGELIQNIAVRPKGNSSLTSISQQGSEHFSFKIEFDHNDETTTYHGLDKLCLNNLGQDPSCMKDFMAYHLMNDMGVPAPLSSYVLMQVNGEDFGLYLAVEAVEDSFCYRNYGENPVQLYKPDSFAMDTLDTSAMLKYEEGSSLWTIEQIMNGSYYADASAGERADILGTMLSSVFPPEQTAVASLKYLGEDAGNYQNLWDTAVFKPDAEDKTRAINSIEILNNSENPQTVLDVDSLLKYFIVHGFVNNYDGYTSMFVHNFYLCEQDGILSMIPWDYNLAFGSFTYESAVSSILNPEEFNAIPETGTAMNSNTSMINYPIDTPVFSVEMQDRPLLNALLSDAETLEIYHEFYNTFLQDCFENGKYQEIYTEIYTLIRPYVEKNLTFYDISKFESGAEAMQKYLQYRTESIRKQLDGDLPATLEGQKQNAENLVIPENLNLSALADFASLKPELNSGMIIKILHIFLQDDFSYDTKGTVNAVYYYKAHPLKLAGKIPALMQIPYIRNLILPKAVPVLLIFILIPVIIIFIVRRRNKLSDR